MTPTKTTAPDPTTGIGSLPHHNVDAALAFSFQLGVPFLPQIPIRNPREFMIAQALDGLPGLQVAPDGSIRLDADAWRNGQAEFGVRLEQAFARSGEDREAFSAFEPLPESSLSWQPFIWECAERRVSDAKLQLAGPLTSQWAIHTTNPVSGSTPDPHPGLLTQIYRLVLARALGMTRRLGETGARPWIFLDEPGLFGFNPQNPRHRLALEELRLLIQTLRKDGAQVGLHCCSNTHWPSVLGLGLDFLSIDTSLSLESLLGLKGDTQAPQNRDDREHAGQDLLQFEKQGGKLALGVIPTGSPELIHSLRPREVYQRLEETTYRGLGREVGHRLLDQSLYTPACGLGLQSVGDAEMVLDLLAEVNRIRADSA